MYHRSFLATARSDLAILVCVCVAALLAFGGCSRPPEGAEAVSWDAALEQSMPEDLKEALVAYWAARSRMDWHAIYTMEAPHIRWAYTEDEFVRRYQRAGKVSSVVVRRIESPHPQVRRVAIQLTVMNSRVGEEETFYPQDDWVNVDGRWYHVWKIPFFDKFA